MQSPINRFTWQVSGLVLGRGAAFLTLIVIARYVGLQDYGSFVIVLAALELSIAPWKPTSQQAAAAALGTGATHRSLVRFFLFWWLAVTIPVSVFVFWFAGAAVTAALALASLLNAVMVSQIPANLLAGHQQKIAIGMIGSQVTRLVVVLVLVASDSLSLATVLFAHVLGYILGAYLMRSGSPQGEHDGRSVGLMTREVGVEALAWIEANSPVLVVALLLGLGSAGGFDLLFKLAIAMAETIAGIGLVLLPSMVKKQESAANIVARGLRIPSVAALVAGIVFAFAVTPIIQLGIDNQLQVGRTPLYLSGLLLLAPWMGVTKSSLITSGATGWILPSQLATASAALIAFFVIEDGVELAAAAVLAASILSAAIRWFGMRANRSLPSAKALLSWSLMRADFQWVRSRGQLQR